MKPRTLQYLQVAMNGYEDHRRIEHLRLRQSLMREDEEVTTTQPPSSSSSPYLPLSCPSPTAAHLFLIEASRASATSSLARAGAVSISFVPISLSPTAMAAADWGAVTAPGRETRDLGLFHLVPQNCRFSYRRVDRGRAREQETYPTRPKSISIIYSRRNLCAGPE